MKTAPREAVNIASTRSGRPVISMVSAMPVSGARTIAVNSAHMPTTAKAMGENSSDGSPEVAHACEQRAEGRAHREERGEEPAGSPRRVAERADEEAHGEEQDQLAQHDAAGQDRLGEIVAAADEQGEEPRHHADDRTHHRGASQRRQRAHGLGDREQAKGQGVVGRRRPPRAQRRGRRTAGGARARARRAAPRRIPACRRGERGAPRRPRRRIPIVARTSRGVKLSVSSSNTKIDAPIGALKATARPAPAPAAFMMVRSGASGRKRRAHVVPIAAPICTVGPSRPSASPDPMARRPPKNFTGTTLRVAGSA